MRKIRELEWLEPGETLESDEVAATEAHLGVSFPADYAAIVGAHSGASNPKESEFVYFVRGERQTGNFGVLLSLRDGEYDGLVEAVRDLGDQIPAGIIPVVETGWGDFVCLDYRESNEPTLAYFSHESSGDESIITIARSFSSFLDSLYVPDEDEF